MITSAATPERHQHQIEDVRILADQVRFDLPLANRDLQSAWPDLERRLPDPTQPSGAGPFASLDPLIEELRRFRNRVRHQAGTHGSPMLPTV